MLDSDPGANQDGPDIYECPDCDRRVEATGSCCCPDCGAAMLNLSRPRHR
jgi:hypothetical protein